MQNPVLEMNAGGPYDWGGPSTWGGHLVERQTRETQVAQLQQAWQNWQGRLESFNFARQQFPNCHELVLEGHVRQARAKFNTDLGQKQLNEFSVAAQAQEAMQRLNLDLENRNLILKRLENGLNQTQVQLNQEHAQLTAQDNQLQADRQQWQNDRNTIAYTLTPHYTWQTLDTYVKYERTNFDTALQSYEQVRLHSNVLPQNTAVTFFQHLDNQRQRLERLEKGVNQTQGQGQLKQELTEHTERYAQLQQDWLNWHNRQNDLTFLQQRFSTTDPAMLRACVEQERTTLAAALLQKQQNIQAIQVQAQQKINQMDQQLNNEQQRVERLENGLKETQEQLNQEFAVLTARGNLLGYSATRTNP